MSRPPFVGLLLATFGALVLTPDALLLRLSGMNGLQMTGWRGLLMGMVLVLGWLICSRDRLAALRGLKSGPGLTIVLCQFLNALLFSFGIATAPVAIVLLGIATAPVFSAVFARFIIGEPTRRATWVTTILVIAGIALAVLGGAGDGMNSAGAVFLGALAGLGVAVVLALNFTVLRAHPHLPIPLVIGIGALLAGATGTVLTGPAMMGVGQVWAVALTGLVILPVSFFCLSLAARHTQASNVSLLMLLETVLGPLWVWLAIGERMSPAMLTGGAIVVLSLAIYVIHTGHRATRRARRLRT